MSLKALLGGLALAVVATAASAGIVPATMPKAQSVIENAAVIVIHPVRHRRVVFVHPIHRRVLIVRPRHRRVIIVH